MTLERQGREKRADEDRVMGAGKFTEEAEGILFHIGSQRFVRSKFRALVLEPFGALENKILFTASWVKSLTETP